VGQARSPRRALAPATRPAPPSRGSCRQAAEGGRKTFSPFPSLKGRAWQQNHHFARRYLQQVCSSVEPDACARVRHPPPTTRPAPPSRGSCRQAAEGVKHCLHVHRFPVYPGTCAAGHLTTARTGLRAAADAPVLRAASLRAACRSTAAGGSYRPAGAVYPPDAPVQDRSGFLFSVPSTH